MKHELRAPELVQRLGEIGVEFVVVGGIACIIHGVQYATTDVDVCAPMSRDNLLKIMRAVDDLDPRFRMHPDRLPFYDDIERLVGIRNIYLGTKWGDLDLMSEMPGVGGYPEVAAGAEYAAIEDVRCRVINIDALIAAKTAAGRDKDIEMVRHLRVLKADRLKRPSLFDPAP